MNMNKDDFFPSKYLKASDLKGQSVVVKVDRVQKEKLGEDTKPVIYFQGKQKGMVLNKTNWTAIADLYGDESDDWTDGEIELFEAQVEFQGKVGPGLRVRKVRKPSKIESGPQPKQAVKEDMSDEIPF
jgi:hypothetical protein